MDIFSKWRDNGLRRTIASYTTSSIEELSFHPLLAINTYEVTYAW